MYLENIKILNFKNIKDADISFSEKINCFTGNNGAGKTNLLDAIYYLSVTKSYFNTSDIINVNNEAVFFSLSGEFVKNGKKENVFCAYERNRKKTVKRNDKAYKKFSEHIGLFPVVIVSPGDSVLITGTGEERRRYVDSVISQYDKEYLHELIKYNRILSQRNRLLKNFSSGGNFDLSTIEIYDIQLAKSGRIIYDKRKKFVDDLIPVFSSYYETVSGNKEKVDLKYVSHLNDFDFFRILSENIEKDKIYGYTTKGIHRDDLEFKINGFYLKKSGSQGQQKTFLTALKFAQYSFVKEISGMVPILLLDDIFDKFDSERVSKIIKITSGNFGQIFITDTNPERVKKIIKDKGDFMLFNVASGKITESK